MLGRIEFAFSGFHSPKAQERAGPMGADFIDRVNAETAGLEFASPTRDLILHTIIVDPALGQWPDKITYKRGEPAIGIAVNIAFDEWLSASRDVQIDLLAGALLGGLRQIKESKLCSDDRDKLEQAIERARRSMRDAHEAN
jgi:hypothetical protein